MNNNDSCLSLKHHKKILEAAILIVPALSASHFPQKRGVKKEYRLENITVIDTQMAAIQNTVPHGVLQGVCSSYLCLQLAQSHKSSSNC